MRILHSSDGSRVDAVLRSAERRRLLVLAAEQAAFSLALMLAGLILLLLLGTQILHWYWLAILVSLALGILARRLRLRPLAPYRLAQIIDRRLQLSDSLSTAWFLVHARADGPIARLEIERAERIAQSVRVARAIPFTRSRPWLVSGALAAVAFGLFTVRYLVTNSLSLEQALIPLRAGPVLEADESQALDKTASAPFSPDSRAGLAKAAKTQAGDANGESSAPQASDAGKPAGMAGAQSSSENRTSQSNSTGTMQSSTDGKGDNMRPPGEATSAERAAGDSSAAKNEAAAAEPNSSSLLDNMKDALSSLLSKMRPGSSLQSSPAARSSDEQRSTTQASLGQQRQASQAGAQKESSSEQQSTAGDARGQAAEKAQTSQPRSSSASSERNGSDSRSGVGRQDGNKALKEAEQLAAMGKLAEIIGKRSADLTGDMTVETPSGKQQLKTEYSQRMGHHADLGGEINRDEVPLMYQQYIRDYMEAVRKEQDRPSRP